MKEPPPDKMPLSRRVALMGAGFRSMIGRYPTDLSKAVRDRRASTIHVSGAADLAEVWKSLPSGGGLRAVAWLGHCTTLLRLGERTILTDPVLSPRIGMRVAGMKFGPSRLSATVGVEHLPPIDMVLISHAHFDHLDRCTLRELAAVQKGRDIDVLTARATKRLIPKGFSRVREIDWNEMVEHDGVTIGALRPAHWGARTAWDRHRGFNAYLLRAAEDQPTPRPLPLGGGEEAPVTRGGVLFAGDTAHTDAFDALGPLDLGIFGIGAYDPWHHAHATPEEVWAMATRANCARVLPVHHSTFRLSNEPMHEPIERLRAAAGSDRRVIVETAPGDVQVF